MIICTLLWGGGVVITICSLIPVSAFYESRLLKKGLLEDGWKNWLGRHLDNSDSEWSLWKLYAWEGYIRGYIGHFVVARLADKLFPEKRFQILMVYSIAFTTHFLHIEGMLYLLLHLGIQYLSVRLTKSVTVCWITGLALLYFLHHSNESVDVFYRKDPDKAYVLLICVGMSNLRYIGFGLEYVWQYQRNSRTKGGGNATTSIGKQKSSVTVEVESDLSFMDLLTYQMYLPLLYGGPVMNYDEFSDQVKKSSPSWTFSRTTRFLLTLLKYVTCHLLVEFVLHYVYASALLYEKWSSNKYLKIYHVCGLSMAQVGLFYMKYLIMYGMPAHFATSDGLEPPGQPQCVYSKHRMTDFWKLIDKGLHKWLVRYIYIPCGGSRNGVFRAILSLTVSFCFVVLWHRPTPRHIWWGALSWLGVLVEYIALEVYRTEAVKEFERKHFSPQWSRRFRGFLSSFAFGFLIITNLIFLAGVKMGNIYITRFYTENIWATILIHVSLYGGAQSSMNLE